MRTQTKAAAYGIAAVALAGIVIFSGGTLGVLPIVNSNFNPGAPALLSILLTDPPSVPEGVTAVYVTYTNLGVHVTGLGDGGWVMTGGEGTINTLGLVNLTQTIASSSVPSGVYDMISLTISKVQVEFQGANYTAEVNSGKLIVPFVRGLVLNTSSDAAAVIDIQPTVLNLGNQSEPQFAVATGARALQVPSSEVRPEMHNVGSKSSLVARPWFQDFETNHSNSLTVGSVSLSPTAFNLSLSNPTSDDITVKMIIVTQGGPGSAPANGLGVLAGSVIFTVGGNGALSPDILSTSSGHGMNQLKSVLGGDGYEMNPTSWATFSFKGDLAITSGTTYQVIIIGDHLLAATTVQAG